MHFLCRGSPLDAPEDRELCWCADVLVEGKDTQVEPQPQHNSQGELSRPEMTGLAVTQQGHSGLGLSLLHLLGERGEYCPLSAF